MLVFLGATRRRWLAYTPWGNDLFHTHIRVRRSDAKCTTMKYLAAAAKLLKRRRYMSRVIIDRE